MVISVGWLRSRNWIVKIRQKVEHFVHRAKCCQFVIAVVLMRLTHSNCCNYC